MKILFTRFPLESALGGAELQTLSLMEGLLARGHAVAFAGSCPVLLKECRARGIPTVELSIGTPPVTKIGALTFAWRKRRMRQLLVQMLNQFGSLDAICMLSLSEKLLLTDCAHARGIRVLWIEHDRIGRWLTSNPWLRLLRAQSKLATTITVSDLSKRMYEDLGWDPARIIAIPNGIDPKRLSTPSPKSPVQSLLSSLRLLCIARLSPEKGVDLLIRAVEECPDVRLTIVGTGKREKELQNMIERFKLQGRVTIMDRIDDLSMLFTSHDALVLPSREHDPFGMVAAEAMLAHLPVIVTDACGIAGYLRNGIDALIVKANSVSALKEAIFKVQDPALRTHLAAQGQTTASDAFALERMIDTYEELMKNT